MNHSPDSPDFTPRPFALRTGHDSGASPIVGWGMTPPDDSAITVEWDHGNGGGISVYSSADLAALLHGATLNWADQPNPPEPIPSAIYLDPTGANTTQHP